MGEFNSDDHYIYYCGQESQESLRRNGVAIIVNKSAALWGRIGSSEGFSGGSDVKNLPAMQETWVPSLGGEDALEKGMANHFSILALRTP